MKILQVTPHYYPHRGGVERHVQAISEQLARRGHDVTVVTMATPDVQAFPAIYNGVAIRRLPTMWAGSAYQVAPGLHHYLHTSRANFDIVHVHNYHALMLPQVVAMRPQHLVVTPHLNDRPHSRAAQLLHYPYGYIGRWSLAQADAIVCVSNAERERLIADLQVAPERTTVIPNGVDAQAGAQPAGPKDTYQILCVGRLQAYKQVDRVLAALALLPEPFQLAVIGDGPQCASLGAQARSSGLEHRVSFLGAVTDDVLASLYRTASVVVNMSSAEAFGITVIEALAYGCRVVCSDIPAFRDLAQRFGDHVTLVTDATSAAGAIERAAFRMLPPADLSEYRWDKITARLEEVYANVLQQSGIEQRNMPTVV
ncbi:MAG TPA: glycosyltransferase family 4 protein [Roseiflexaceae bacterium]|nr:glycosyltransferase family 4 protein [Roseiflexaceae bacterium]